MLLLTNVLFYSNWSGEAACAYALQIACNAKLKSIWLVLLQTCTVSS